MPLWLVEGKQFKQFSELENGCKGILDRRQTLFLQAADVSGLL